MIIMAVLIAFIYYFAGNFLKVILKNLSFLYDPFDRLFKDVKRPLCRIEILLFRSIVDIHLAAAVQIVFLI